MNQGMVASSSWKRQGNRFSSRASQKEGSPANTLILDSQTHVGLLTYKTIIHLCCFKPLSFTIICCSNIRKQIQPAYSNNKITASLQGSLGSIFMSLSPISSFQFKCNKGEFHSTTPREFLITVFFPISLQFQ